MGDVINLDTVSWYYPTSYMLERLFTRELFSYADSQDFAAEEIVRPDVATTVPTTGNGGISGGGKT
jgi:hypothetical protein